MQIFDNFPSHQSAQEFIDSVKTRFPDQQGIICDSQEESDKIDPFPFELIPPIVLLLRDEKSANEIYLETLAPAFGGSYAGT